MTSFCGSFTIRLLGHVFPIQPRIALYIPDGYLDNVPLLLVTWVVSLGLIALCLATEPRRCVQ
jgi:hypothetical protein